MLPLLLVAFLPATAAFGWATQRRWQALSGMASDTHVARYLRATCVENAAWACQTVALWFACTWIPGASSRTGVATALYALLNGMLFLDTALFLASGMRLQRSLLTFMSALTEFADTRPWRRHVPVCIIAVLALGALGYRVIAQNDALAPRWEPIAWLGATSSACIALAAWWRRSLPMTFAYEWNNRVIAVQVSVCVKALHAWRSPEQTEHVDARGLPRIFTPVNEVMTYVEPRYPLLRTTRAFTGPEHFRVVLEANEKPHVVILFLESFRAADTGILGAPHRKSVTPCFDALAREGVLWNNFYANGTITSRAMAAAFYGVLPDFRAYSMQAAEAPLALVGMPQLFAKRGYLPAYFCDGPMDWENKRDFFLRHGFPLFFGAPSIRACYPEAPVSEWNFSDEYLMRFHANWLAEQDQRGQPTFSSLLTVTNHMPWEAPDHAPVPDTDIDPSSEYGRYLRTMMYTDQALGLYMKLMREQGLDRKTIFFVLGDHGQQVEHGRIGWSGRYNDGSVRVPLLMLAPGRGLQPAAIKETASQIDLLPTVMDMFDMRETHHAMGSSLLRQCDTRSAITIHPWAPGMASNRVGPFRFVFSFDANVAALYDLSRDPEESTDVSKQHPDLTHAQIQLAWALRHSVNRLHSEHAFAPTPEEPAPATHVRTLGAPADFPMTYGDCAKRANTLSHSMEAGVLARAETHTLGAFMIGLLGHGLTEAQRLRLVQLLLARLNIKTMGELTHAETTLMNTLDSGINQIQARADAPLWFRNIAITVRRLAGIDKNASRKNIDAG